ncbi:putative alanine rich lipoprotein LppW [Pseudonocardia dioxanivorans CB1190]|uniref:Alanine rich lipoprotein LppW n=1 Tax=Pseudonocardia dioxanivorans (strain ATCC 55486 / DSM 44775 / JCM 13855 / CB1190) TaxID=675635 RepID=F4CPW3_PSEUX|nr:alanine rich lipoprotein LppW [Pseudonocardia dioxanivorans]AEA26146.1 putative alanine rich lipoprotein LppW [Pseudonocardia dioxanivorans CB1190]
MNGRRTLRRLTASAAVTAVALAALALVGFGGDWGGGQASAAAATADAPAAAPPSTPATTPVADATPDTATQKASAASAAAVTAAVRAVDAVDAASPSDLGVAVLDRDTGQQAVGARGSEQFYSASVVKLYTVVAILHRVETGEVTLSAADTTDIQRALSLSDDQAMDALWEKFGGPATVSQAIALAGLTDSAPPTDPSQWGEALISARDVVTLYDYVLTSMAPSSRDMIMNALTSAQDTGADGFDQAFGLLAPPRARGVAAKQGWMWIGTQFYLHTTGVLPGDRYVIAIFSKNAASSGSAAARTLVTRATAAATAALTGSAAP